MRFICQKQSLYDAMINVSKAISERSTLPVLEGIKLKLEDSVLELTGYNLEMGIRTSLAVRSEDRGEFMVNCRLFSEMIKKMPADEVLIEVSEGYQITISGGSTTFNLFGSSAADYPELPKKNTDVMIEISQPVLKDMIFQTRFAVAVVDTKPILKGELFELQGGRLTMVAIDGFRLALRYENVKYQDSISFVVPSKTLVEVMGLLGDNEEENVNIYPSGKHIIFEIGGYMVYSRLLEGEFHPYRSAIPERSNTEVILDRKELLSTLERAMLLINDRSPSPVRCYFEGGRLRISCATALGKIVDEIPADVSGPVIEIGFKCRFLLEPLKVIDDDKVKLQMGGSLLPMKIVPVDGDRYTYLVLPVRLPREN